MRAKSIHQLLESVASFGEVLPANAEEDAIACFVCERIVRGDDRIVRVLPEAEHLRARRPDDTKPAWHRMGDPVRCVTLQRCELVLWPWLDLDRSAERAEILLTILPDGRACWLTPMVRGHYREKIAAGCFATRNSDRS